MKYILITLIILSILRVSKTETQSAEQLSDRDLINKFPESIRFLVNKEKFDKYLPKLQYSKQEYIDIYSGELYNEVEKDIEGQVKSIQVLIAAIRTITDDRFKNALYLFVNNQTLGEEYEEFLELAELVQIVVGQEQYGECVRKATEKTIQKFKQHERDVTADSEEFKKGFPRFFKQQLMTETLVIGNMSKAHIEVIETFKKRFNIKKPSSDDQNPEKSTKIDL